MPAWFRYAFKASRNIHAVADDVVRLDDDVPDVDPHAKEKASAFRGLLSA